MLLQISQQEFNQLHSIHWGIECYHELSSNCVEFRGLWLGQVRQSKLIFCSIRAFTQLELMRAEELIENWYEVQRNLYLQVARQFILEHLKQK